VGLKTHSYEKKQAKEEGFVTYYAGHCKLLHNQVASPSSLASARDKPRNDRSLSLRAKRSNLMMSAKVCCVVYYKLLPLRPNAKILVWQEIPER